MNSFIKLFAFLLIICVFSACEEEFLIVSETEEEESETIKLVRSNLKGDVFTIDGDQISSATIELSVSERVFGDANSDDAGQFGFNAIMASENSNLLTITHPTYGTSYHSIALLEDRTHFTKVRMQETDMVNLTGAQTLAYNTEELSFALSLDQLITNQGDAHMVEVKTFTNKELNQNLLLPREVEGSAGNSRTYLDHQFSFQINIQDQNGADVKFENDESLTLEINQPIKSSNPSLWKFDNRSAQWKKAELSASLDNDQVIISELGLYTIASPLAAQIITTQLIDADGNPVTNALAAVYDENGTIIDQVYSDSEGFFENQIPEDTVGEIRVSKEGFTASVISFSDAQVIQEDVIQLSKSVVACLNVEIDLSTPFVCTADLAPSALSNADLSFSDLFTLLIGEDTYGVIEENASFADIDWLSFGPEPVEYTLVYQDESGSAVNCDGQINVVDNLQPSAVCLQRVTSILDENDELILFAKDFDFGSIDAGCERVLDFRIARGDECASDTGSCLDQDFKETLEFGAADADKVIDIILRVTDLHGNRSQCTAELLIGA